MALDIKLYGTERCHKTQYYKTLLRQKGFKFSFLDVEENYEFAEELRNPPDKDLEKWLNKLK